MGGLENTLKMADEKVEKIMKGNLKLSVFNSFPYDELKKICDAICNFGYDCEFAENGNVIFQKKQGGETQQKQGSQQQRQGEFKPTEEQLKKWAEEPITEKQKNKLKMMGYNRDPSKLSKLEAYQLINQNDQKGIPKEEEDPESEEDMYL
jgi:hypothetical protein